MFVLGANVRERRQRARSSAPHSPRSSAEGARLKAEVNISAAAASVPLGSGVTGKERRAGKNVAAEESEKVTGRII